MTQRPNWLPYPSLDPILLKLLGLGLVFRAFLAYWMPLGYDEGYYYLYTQHLDWSYFDHPVMVALTTGLGRWLTGLTHPFTLRLGSLLLYTISLGLLYFTSRYLFNLKAARYTLFLASIIPIFQIGFGVLTLPDSPLILFWSATLLLSSLEFFQSPPSDYQPSYRLVGLGCLMGLACLSKYHGFVLALSYLGFCLSISPYRRVFRSHWLVLALLVFLLTLLPLLYWNAQHDWISLKFQFVQRFRPTMPAEKTAYNPLQVLAVFAGGVGLLFPSLGLPLWWSLGRSLGIAGPLPKALVEVKAWKTKLAFLLWLALPLPLGLTLLGGKTQILATWPMPGFWSGTLLLGLYASYWEQGSRRAVRRWLGGSALAIVSLLLLFLLHIHTGMLLKTGHNPLGSGWLTPDQDPASELLDIDQLRRGVERSPTLKRALEQADFVFTNAYYLGGLIDLALRPIAHVPVTCFSYDPRGFAFWPNSQDWLGQNAIYITLEHFQQNPALTQEFSQFFQHFWEIGQVPLLRGGVVVERFYFYQAQHLRRPYQAGPDSVR